MNQLPSMVEVAQALEAALIALKTATDQLERIGNTFQIVEQQRRTLSAIAEVLNRPPNIRPAPGCAPEDDLCDDINEIRALIGIQPNGFGTLCEHANECPQTCRCPAHCVCRRTMCPAASTPTNSTDTGHRRWKAGVTDTAAMPSVEEHPNGTERWFAFLENVLKASRDERVAMGTGTDGRMAGEALGPQEARMLIRIARAAENLYVGRGSNFDLWRDLNIALGAHGYTNTGAEKQAVHQTALDTLARFVPPTTKEDALTTLAEFARTAPGRLPHHVEEALRIAEGK